MEKRTERLKNPMMNDLSMRHRAAICYLSQPHDPYRDMTVYDIPECKHLIHDWFCLESLVLSLN
jgi:hypothetical protein